MKKLDINKKNNSLRRSFNYSYKLLTKKEKFNLKLNIVLSFFAGLFEILSVLTFFPLVSIIIEPNLITNNKLINNLWNYFGEPNPIKFLIILASYISIISIASAFINLSSQILATRFASSAQERLSKELYKKIIYSPYAWHLNNNPNIIRNIFINNLNLWNRNVIRIIPIISGQIAAITIAFLTISISTPKLGFILLIISGTLLAFLLEFIRNKSSKLMNKVREKEELSNIFLTETLSGIKDIKLSSNEENFIKNFYNLNHIIIKNFASASNWNTLPSYLVILFGQLIILFTATILFLNGIRGGELAAIMAVIVLVFSRVIPILNRLGSSLTNIANVSSWINKTYKINQEINAEDLKNNYKKNLDFQKTKLNWEKLSFSKVEFKYPNSKIKVINNLNLEFKKGFHYALVGYSGAGKSTIIDLFLGLLEPTNGIILIDGKNLCNIDIKKWQRNISYVPQDPLISNLSLRENIAFGVPNKNIDDEKVNHCLEQTDLLKVSESLNEGIYTKLGHQGIKLSGGQKQRVAISRALYQKADILVLDEATSALDTQTEKAIQKTIRNLKNKMTIISIAHRLSTIKSCDCIFLLEGGKVKDYGTFDELEITSKDFRKFSSEQIIKN